MKFSEAVRGVRAEMLVEVPGTRAPSGKTLTTLARPLVEAEEESVVTAAVADAKAGGIEKPKPGDPLYDAAVMVHTVHLGYVDPDSPDQDRTLTFDGGAAQIRASLGADEIAYLYERHEVHQNTCSPSMQKASPEQLIDITKAIAGPDGERRFLGLAPGLRVSWARFMAAQCVSLLEGKLPSGWSSQVKRSRPLVKARSGRRK